MMVHEGPCRRRGQGSLLHSGSGGGGEVAWAHDPRLTCAGAQCTSQPIPISARAVSARAPGAQNRGWLTARNGGAPGGRGGPDGECGVRPSSPADRRAQRHQPLATAAAARRPAATAAAPLLALQAELTFDGVAYIFSVRCTGGDTLEVVAERKEDASAWAATFAAKCECGGC